MFQIKLRQDLPDDATLSVHDFSVRLVHVCDGVAPPADELDILYNEAILVIAEHFGILRVINDEGDELPF